MIKIIRGDITTFVSKENVTYITYDPKNHHAYIRFADKNWLSYDDVTSVEC